MKKSMEELVQQARKGDQEAIAALYEQTYSSVYQSVRAVIKDEDEALDIVQDSYIKGFQSLDKLGDPEKYQAWMKRLASNMAIDFLRKKKPVLFSERIDEEGEEIDLRREDDCLEHMPEEVIDRQETTRLMNDILGTLSEEQRLAIVMSYYEERSVREIAESLSCSENTVKSRLNYGRKKIEAEVRALEKKGTKLYSLAPMPFFTWLLRTAKEQGFSFTLDGADAVLATGAAAAGEATATAGAATVAGETVTAASGNVTAGVAAKAATSAAGKTIATKVVAGTLAVTMAAGTGAVVVNNINREKANKEAHIIYEEFLGRYQDAFEMDGASFRLDYDRFWSEVSADILEQNPDIDLFVTNSWYLNYTSGEDFDEGISVPDTVYEPNMNQQKLLADKLEDEIIYYTYFDIDGNGVDEMFIATVYRGELQRHTIDAYAVKNGTLLRGKVNWEFDGTSYTWELECTYEANYVAPGVVYINLGKGFFDAPIVINEPNSGWSPLYKENEKTTIPTDDEFSYMSEEEKYSLIKKLEGTYRIYSGYQFGEFRPYHELNLSIIGDEIVITDMGEPVEVTQLRQSYIDNLIAYREQARSPLPTPEEQDMLTIANLGTLTISIQTVSISRDGEVLLFDPVSFFGGRQNFPLINRLYLPATTDLDVYGCEYLGLDNANFDERFPLVTQEGQELQREGSLVLERQ